MNATRAVVMARVVGIVIVAVVVQVRVAASLTLWGVRPELTLLLALAAGVAAGPDRGAVVGFFLGLAYDLFLQSPLGLTALVYAMVAYAAGAMQVQMASHRPTARMLFVGLGSAVSILLWVVVGRLLDAVAPTPVEALRVAALAGAVNAAVGLPATRLWAWVFAPEAPTRLGP